MKIVIANDHGGYELKKQIIEEFSKRGYEFIDMGSHNTDIVRYPYFAADTVNKVLEDPEHTRGILICSTGIGMSIAANKFKGIRAALCHDTFTAKMTRKHNNSNVLCLGAMVTGKFVVMDIVETWLATEFEGGRHCISLDIIEKIENENITSNYSAPPLTDRK